MTSETTKGAHAVRVNSLVMGRRLGDLNPGWAVNPNRISRALPFVRRPCAPVAPVRCRHVNAYTSCGREGSRSAPRGADCAICVPSGTSTPI